MRSLINELEAAIGGPDSEILCRSLLVRILIGIRRHVLSTGPRADEPNDDARLVAEVDAVLRRNLHQAPTRAMVAAAVGLSEAHLARRYRAATGDTVHTRLAELQVDQAAMLLRDSFASIAQIASEVGFRSASHFGKVFRSARGATPTEWRTDQST